MMTMRSARIRHLPVVTDQGLLVGIITDRDVRRAAASDAPPLAEYELPALLEKLRVQDIMTPEVMTVHCTTPVVEAGLIFLEKRSAVSPSYTTTGSKVSSPSPTCCVPTADSAT